MMTRLIVLNSLTMSAFLATGDGRPLTFEQVPFAHPVYILYSSGTTGVPKCIVHSGGVRPVLCNRYYISYSRLELDRVYC